MVMKSKSRKKLVITRRDWDVFAAIYQTGIMAAGHILRLFFEGRGYGYVRLRMLHDAGYLGTDPYLEPVPGTRKRRKVTSFYFLRKKGIDYLSKFSKNVLRPPWKNKIHRKRFKEFYYMGELWCRFYEQGIIKAPQSWHPSRLAKKRLGINHFVPLHSVFYPAARSDNKCVALYFFDEDTDNRKITMLRNALPAVDLSGVRSQLIICETYKVMKSVLQRFTLKYPESNIRIILHDHIDLLLEYLKNGSDIFYQELSCRLAIRGGLRRSGIFDPTPYFAIAGDGSKIYLAELLTGKLLNLTGLKYKAKSINPPDKLCLYLPDMQSYETIKFLLPENLKSLHLFYRGEK